jgi:hypothetical protein
MKNLAELSIELRIEELWIELNTVRMHHPSKRLDYHQRASQAVGPGPTAERHLCVSISAPALAPTEQISRVHVDFTHLSKQIAMPGVCFQLLAEKEKRSDNCSH